MSLAFEYLEIKLIFVHVPDLKATFMHLNLFGMPNSVLNVAVYSNTYEFQYVDLTLKRRILVRISFKFDIP